MDIHLSVGGLSRQVVRNVEIAAVREGEWAAVGNHTRVVRIGTAMDVDGALRVVIAQRAEPDDVVRHDACRDF
jgi:hypothetical protein